MLGPPEGLLGRTTEWAALGRIWAQRRADLVFAVGRRRAGKSFVLTRFAAAVGGIYYQATRRTEAEQLAELSRVIGDRLGDDALARGATFSSWEQLLDYLGRRAAAGPLLLVLDEFPYLVDALPALPSILQSAWDHVLKNTHVKLVLCGSYVSAMKRLEEADQPLFGRRTAKLVFGAFSVAEAALFMPGWITRDQWLAYGVFGNLPGQLSFIDSGHALDQAVAETLLDPSGVLSEDADRVLDTFSADSRVPNSILAAVAQGEHTWSGITSRVGMSGGSLLRPLRWLEEMDLIARVVPITEAHPERSKRALYRLLDPYLAFWHRFVAPLRNSGTLGLVPGNVLWPRIVARGLNEHMGPVFEAACRDWVRVSPSMPFQPFRVGEWWDSERAEQVDIVAIGGEGELLVGECKWGTVGRADLGALERRAAHLAGLLGTTGPPLIAVFTGTGEVDDTVKSAIASGRVRLFTGADVCRTGP